MFKHQEEKILGVGKAEIWKGSISAFTQTLQWESHWRYRVEQITCQQRVVSKTWTQVKLKQWPILLRSLELSFTLFTSYIHLQTGKLRKNLPRADEDPGFLEGTNTKLPWGPHWIPHIKISTENKSTSKIIKYNITSSPEQDSAVSKC